MNNHKTSDRGVTMGWLRWKMQLATVVVLFNVKQSISEGDDFRPKPLNAGAWVHASRGEIWPKPKAREKYATFMAVDPKNFTIKRNEILGRCVMFQQLLDRFSHRLFVGDTQNKRKSHITPNVNKIQNNPLFRGFLKDLKVDMMSVEGCEYWPHQNMNEKYMLLIDIRSKYERKALLQADTIWGVLRGMESFSQMVYNTQEQGYINLINSTFIQDEPRYPYRGVMLDSSRHFLSKKVILDNLDLMEMNKLNVFHWHISDDNSFPFVSMTFPNMSEYGAYDPVTHVYTPQDVAEIKEAARIRGIRVIPEFDTPGHTKSWELGHPGLLANCEDPHGNPTDVYGPMDPTNELTFQFLQHFFDETTRVFPDNLVFIGGDEVELDNCWKRNKRIADTLEKWGMRGQFDQLEGIFLDNLMRVFKTLPQKKQFIVWQEVFDNNLHFNQNETIVNVWKNWGKGWKRTLNEATHSGYRVLLSAPWYLNYISYGSDWTKYYSVDPSDFGGDESQRKLMMGGELCLWGEFVNSINALPRLWPRASAPAEVLWSPAQNREKSSVLQDAAQRLQEHECRMMARGYPVQPVVGPGFCPHIHWGF